MSSMVSQNRVSPLVVSRIGQVGKGLVMAGAVAAMCLTAIPSTADARGNVGAAIGLGILGGVIAGAAIAATTPPYYAPPAYGYPPQQYPGYYYPSAPAYYPGSQPYYWSAPYYR